MKLKVCGLTQLPQIQALKDLQADFMGFIFYEKSPRYVLNHLTLDEIGEIPHTGKVGVFVNESIKGIVEISRAADLDVIQLHGDEDPKFVSDLQSFLSQNIKIIKAVRMGRQAVSEVQNTVNEFTEYVDYFLFDTDSKTYGGTGQTFDWQLLNEIEIPKPYFLSGGISAENSGQIASLNQKPYALDINSRFESRAGIKDLEKIKKFKNTIDDFQKPR